MLRLGQVVVELHERVVHQDVVCPGESVARFSCAFPHLTGTVRVVTRSRVHVERTRSNETRSALGTRGAPRRRSPCRNQVPWRYSSMRLVDHRTNPALRLQPTAHRCSMYEAGAHARSTPTPTAVAADATPARVTQGSPHRTPGGGTASPESSGARRADERRDCLPGNRAVRAGERGHRQRQPRSVFVTSQNTPATPQAAQRRPDPHGRRLVNQYTAAAPRRGNSHSTTAAIP